MRSLLSIPVLSSFVMFSLAASLGLAQRDKVPNNGPKATVLRDTDLYVSADPGAQKLATISAGREVVVMESNGPWLRVYTNTDVEAPSGPDAPVLGPENAATPVSGWIQAKGVVGGGTPKGDMILFGEASTEEVAASEPHPAQGTAQAAQLLYQRVAEFFPQSPLAPEAAWRSADIRWQLDKADVFSLPSAHEKDAYLREQIDDTQMRKIEKLYPHSRWSDLAAWDMLDNQICGDWQGSTECPEKEAAMYERYATEHPDSSKAPEALYDAAYRQGVLKDMYEANAENKRSEQAQEKAAEIAGRLASKYPDTDYAARAAALVYKLEASIPIYGTDR
ncbi:MAG TPA: outer membrane protein assembly factor BamD [Acidobacteriaceae bacterium]|jgi:hypothetical protein|nr:outer membrane protein assembly factor BamD [Acidobacteriaceae bacterium]